MFDGDRYSEKSEAYSTNSSVNGMTRRLEAYIEKFTGEGDIAAYTEGRSVSSPWSQRNVRVYVFHRSVTVTGVQFLLC